MRLHSIGILFGVVALTTGTAGEVALASSRELLLESTRTNEEQIRAAFGQPTDTTVEAWATFWGEAGVRGLLEPGIPGDANGPARASERALR